jgi:hypothetical protein
MKSRYNFNWNTIMEEEIDLREIGCESIRWIQ